MFFFTKEKKTQMRYLSVISFVMSVKCQNVLSIFDKKIDPMQ